MSNQNGGGPENEPTMLGDDGPFRLADGLSEEQILCFLDQAVELLAETLGDEFVPEAPDRDHLLDLSEWGLRVAIAAQGLLARQGEEDEDPPKVETKVEDPEALRAWLLNNQRMMLDDWADALDAFEAEGADFRRVRSARRNAERTGRRLEQFEWCLTITTEGEK